MEKSSDNTFPSILVDLFSLHIVFDLIHNTSSFFLSYWSLFQCKFQLFSKSDQKNKNFEQGKNQIISPYEEELDDGYLLGKEINKLMETLGIQGSLEGGELQKRWGCDEICGLFEEEPSLQEIREAFDVFDQNKDGFIDEEELQRVLCILGLKQGSELQSCSKMIRVFDENGDGRIDFKEFVGFMLNNFD